MYIRERQNIGIAKYIYTCYIYKIDIISSTYMDEHIQNHKKLVKGE